MRFSPPGAFFERGQQRLQRVGRRNSFFERGRCLPAGYFFHPKVRKAADRVGQNGFPTRFSSVAAGSQPGFGPDSSVERGFSPAKMPVQAGQSAVLCVAQRVF